jgi:hypothetical protein
MIATQVDAPTEIFSSRIAVNPGNSIGEPVDGLFIELKKLIEAAKANVFDGKVWRGLYQLQFNGKNQAGEPQTPDRCGKQAVVFFPAAGDHLTIGSLDGEGKYMVADRSSAVMVFTMDIAGNCSAYRNESCPWCDWDEVAKRFGQFNNLTNGHARFAN